MTAPRRALIVVDVQQEHFAGPLEIQYPSRAQSFVNIIDAIESANARDLPVAVVQHQMPQGAPVFVEGTVGWSLHPAMERHIDPASKRVCKQYGSVFAGTDVAQWLHANNVDTITIVGYTTNNCNLATAVEAEGLGFVTEILSDATGTTTLANAAGVVSAESLHTALMVLLHSNFAAVSTTAQWIEALQTGSTLPKSNLAQSAIDGRSAAARLT